MENTMYAAIRQGKAKAGMAEELAQRIKEGAIPIISDVPGFSPLRTDSCQLVSKICWCVKTFGEMMDAPKWLEPTGFFCFAPACAGRFGRM